MKQSKKWGDMREIFESGTVSVHHLKIKKDGFCSEHRHQFKSNLFFVVSGNLKLIIWNESGMKDETVVWPGETTEIPPGVYHKFEALTDVECIEICEVKFMGEDIKRRTEGGVK